MGGSSSPLANVVNSGIVEMNSAHPTFFKMFATAVDGERGERIAAVPVLGNTPVLKLVRHSRALAESVLSASIC